MNAPPHFGARAVGGLAVGSAAAVYTPARCHASVRRRAPQPFFFFLHFWGTERFGKMRGCRILINIQLQFFFLLDVRT